MEINNQSSKNYQSYETIKEIYEKSFKKVNTNITVKKLSGGMKNAVYLIEDNDEKIVLKIGSQNETVIISVDKAIMWWEARMLEFFESIDVPTPKLLHFDNNNELCQSPCIFMSYISGKNFSKEKENLSDEEISSIEYQLGIFNSRICSVKSKKFFLPSQPDKKFSDNYDFVLNLFILLLEDAQKNNVDLGQEGYEQILDILKVQRNSINNIKNLCLCHTDIWDGNVLVEEGQVVGIIDLADLYFCDELMTFYFHTIDGKTSEKFLNGFNIKALNCDEKIRIEIYRMYVILKMIVDCKIKNYGKFDWMYDNLNSRVRILQKK